MTYLQELIKEVTNLNKRLEELGEPETAQFSVKYFDFSDTWAAYLNCNPNVLFSLEEIKDINEYYTNAYPIIQTELKKEAIIQQMKDRIVALVIEELSKL
jgi:hypothetical protein